MKAWTYWEDMFDISILLLQKNAVYIKYLFIY